MAAMQAVDAKEQSDSEKKLRLSLLPVAGGTLKYEEALTPRRKERKENRRTIQSPSLYFCLSLRSLRLGVRLFFLRCQKVSIVDPCWRMH
jgi:hypothetical protein